MSVPSRAWMFTDSLSNLHRALTLRSNSDNNAKSLSAQLPIKQQLLRCNKL
jgi:hypothetical protein